MDDTATLGTLLRHLTELCDGDVTRRYAAHGLDYRPRYTPIVKVLHAQGACSIRTISAATGVTHSAASQTVAQMTKDGLVRIRPGQDARERIIALTPAAKRLVPRLHALWAETEDAARTLDAELGLSLPALLRRAIDALERRPLSARIAAAAVDPVANPASARKPCGAP